MSADDPVSPEENGQGEAPGMDRHTNQAVQQRVDGAVEYADAAHDRIDDLAAQVNKLQASIERQLQAHEQERAALRRRIEDLERRTDLLRLVEQADQADGSQRSHALCQHLRRKARRDPDEPDIASIDAASAFEALHHPDVDRTTIYSDMQRCVRIIDDEDLCWYQDGELWLDLRSRDLGSVEAPQHAVSDGQRVEAPQQDSSGYGAPTGTNGGET